MKVDSDVSLDDAKYYINNNFRKLKHDNKLMINEVFEFTMIMPCEVNVLINQLNNSSSAGVNGIPVKILKYCCVEFAELFAYFFNECIKVGHVPVEFKYAIVSPLYKGKGEVMLMDNYRGISVLPPIGKIFERALGAKIVKHFEENDLFCTHQHGFRARHSCETALVSIIDEWKENISENKINLSMFIDFKKHLT